MHQFSNIRRFIVGVVAIALTAVLAGIGATPAQATAPTHCGRSDYTHLVTTVWPQKDDGTRQKHFVIKVWDKRAIPDMKTPQCVEQTFNVKGRGSLIVSDRSGLWHQTRHVRRGSKIFRLARFQTDNLCFDFAGYLIRDPGSDAHSRVEIRCLPII